jgi:hypothetical protein
VVTTPRIPEEHLSKTFAMASSSKDKGKQPETHDEPNHVQDKENVRNDL